MRWKAQLYENSGLNASDPWNYIFRSRKYLPQHKDLMQFENDFLELVKSVKFKKVKKGSYTNCTKTYHLLRNLKMFPFLQTKLTIFMKLIKTPTLNC